MKILLYDIETTPNLGYTWGKYEQNVIEFKREWTLLSFAYKWLDSAKVTCHTRQSHTEEELVRALHKVLSQAEVIVAHNGKSFDNKKANAKFLQFGLKPIPPVAVVDTKEVAKRHFQLNSNKLDDIGRFLKLGRKIKLEEGFDLWLRCMAGDKKAFQRMAEYNKQDVTLLEKVYKKLLPWIKLPATLGMKCERCNGALRKEGLRRTITGLYQRYQCMSCGGWSRSRTAEKDFKPQRVGL